MLAALLHTAYLGCMARRLALFLNRRDAGRRLAEIADLLLRRLDRRGGGAPSGGPGWRPGTGGGLAWRPDLAAESLEDVASPTLLIVGGADWQVLELNEAAARLLRCEHEVAIVPGATHLFEEPGALERVADLAVAWLSRYASLPAGTASTEQGAR